MCGTRAFSETDFISLGWMPSRPWGKLSCEKVVLGSFLAFFNRPNNPFQAASPDALATAAQAPQRS